MSLENQWQSCEKCGRDMRFEFSIRQDIWNKLPDNWRDKILCMECFLEELEPIAPDQEINLNDFAFLGIVGNINTPSTTKRGMGGILTDNPNVKTQ